jgi:protein TonB
MKSVGNMIVQKRAADNTTVTIRATHLGAVTPSSLTKFDRSDRRPARWARRTGGALFVSAFAHAVAALTIGGIVRVTASSSGHEGDVLDVEIAAVASTPQESPVQEPLVVNDSSRSPSKSEPTQVRLVAHRRATSRLTQSPATALTTVAAGAASPLDEEIAPARFVLSAGTVVTRPHAPVGPAGSPAVGVARDAYPLNEGEVSVPARLLWASPLVYPPAARRAEIEIDLPVQIVVDAGGRVSSTRALGRAGYGLDEAAVRAIQEYRFSPALYAGRAVPVRMRWTVQFRLR